MRCLNLFAGLGGNRELWKDVNVVAVEIHRKIAGKYQQRFPKDEIVIADAFQYLPKHYHEFDFIWASPECPTHSLMRLCASKRGDYPPKLPDLRLYSLIIFLKHFHEGKWVVENVIPYYETLIKPMVQLDRHLFWSNFSIPFKKFEKPKVKHQDVSGKHGNYGFDLNGVSGVRKDHYLRSTINPKIGLYILQCAQGKIVSLRDFT